MAHEALHWVPPLTVGWREQWEEDQDEQFSLLEVGQIRDLVNFLVLE